ncbi:hypothetical protein ACWC0C_33045 [Streptomyces sp. NPDC001709]
MTVMNIGMRRRPRHTGMSGRQVLMAQAAVVGSMVAALVVKELPGIMRELRIYRMTGGLRANRRYP